MNATRAGSFGFAAIGVEHAVSSVRVADLGERALLRANELAQLDGLGIDTVGVDDRGAVELAAAACRTALDQARLDAGDVDALVVVQSRVPDKLMASEATRLQAAIGAERAVTFGVGELGCVSVNAALAVAGALVGSGAAANVLVAHGSVPPAPRLYRHPVTVNGTGGVAAVLRREDEDASPRVLASALETNGEYWDLFAVDYKDRPVAEWVEACRSLRDYSFKLAVESRNRFQTLNAAVLRDAGVQASDVRAVVMQNLSAGAFRFYEEMLGVEVAKACKDNLAAHGHLGSMDVLLNLRTATASGELRDGDLVLVMNNSPVAAWASMVVQV